MKYLIAGLGNIGAEYAGTRHNIGFDVVDTLAARHQQSFQTARYGDVAQFRLKNKSVWLLKPSTYMNLSGKAIQFWLQQEKIEVHQLLVVTDDLALPFSHLRLRPKGTDGGHNGLKSIQSMLLTTDYARLRIGIGAPYPKGQQVDFVLGPWSKEEATAIPLILSKAADAASSFVLEGLPVAMNRFNGSV